jgi:hypothetical protein
MDTSLLNWETAGKWDTGRPDIPKIGTLERLDTRPSPVEAANAPREGSKVGER